MESQTKYPNITVKLVGTDGNAFAIIGTVKKALRRANVPQEEISQFTRESMAGNYDNVLQTAMKWVNVE